MSCQVEDCGGAKYCRGYCVKHYERCKKYGSPHLTAYRIFGPVDPGLLLPDGRRACDLAPREGYEVLAARILSRLQPGPEGCWLWQGAVSPDGYGRTSKNVRGGPKTSGLTHRALYEALIGPLTSDHLDHLCRRRNCCNPGHLDDVPARTNLTRGLGPIAMKARQRYCIHGHEFTPENTYVRRDRGTRQCRQCEHDRYIKRRDKNIGVHRPRKAQRRS